MDEDYKAFEEWVLGLRRWDDACERYYSAWCRSHLEKWEASR